MSLSSWFAPPRHLVASFLLVTLLPLALVILFGWRLLQQDRELERQQIEATREQAADLVAGALEQTLVSLEQSLQSPDALASLPSTEDSLAISFSPETVQAWPPGRLLYDPLPSPGESAAPQTFAAGEALEYRDHDPVKAAAWFAALARSPDAATRAGALIRLARNLRKTGRVGEALDTYDRAARIERAAIGEVPVGLFARWARCTLLSELQRGDQLREEARQLQALLLDGRWRISRPVFELHFADVSAWTGDRSRPTLRIALSEAVEHLRGIWLRPDEPVSARELFSAGDTTFTVLWQRTPGRMAALIAGPQAAETHWLARVRALEQRQHVRVSLQDGTVKRTPADVSRRAASDTGLPWTVLVASDAQTMGTTFGARRRLWLAGLASLFVLVAAGTYVTGRAVARELAVARLQSDFVAAVSHEFRTPLTSLRQLTEMLIDRPATDAARTRTYYQALARQTDRLHRLVESLLDFGRMEAGTSPYRLEPADARGVITAVVEQFAADAAARGHRIELRVAQSATIAVDREAFTNALWNLLDNAVKYSPESSVVHVDVECAAGRLVIAVRDTGFGIPREEQPRIFGKFVRGERAKAERITGTGIGLAMVHHIVRGHGGTIDVRSEPGAGSTFTMALPVTAAVAELEEAKCLGS